MVDQSGKETSDTTSSHTICEPEQNHVTVCSLGQFHGQFGRCVVRVACSKQNIVDPPLPPSTLKLSRISERGRQTLRPPRIGTPHFATHSTMMYRMIMVAAMLVS